MALRIAAGLFFLGAVALMIRPDLVASSMGVSALALSPELRWALRFMGVILLIPSVLAPLVAAFAGERGLRQACAAMAFISAGIAAFTLFSPGKVSSGKISMTLACLAMSLIFFIALRGRRRNR